MKYTIKTGGKVGLIKVYDQSNHYVDAFWGDNDTEAVAKAIAEITARRREGEYLTEFEV